MANAKWVRVVPSRGVNADDPTAGLLTEDTYVAEASDLEFHDGAAFSRHGITEIVPDTPLAADNVYSHRFFSVDAGSAIGSPDFQANVIIVDDGINTELRVATYDSTTMSITQPVGGVITLSPTTLPGSIAAVNGSIYMSGPATNSIVEYIPGAGHAVLGGGMGAWYYLIGHKSRLVAARKVGALASDPYTLGWSVAGDTTDWSGFGGSMAHVLIDGLDAITGMVNLRDLVVILRMRGITLGRTTGQAEPAFYFERFESDGVGCTHPQITSWNRSIVIFGSEDDIYAFNGAELRPLGGKARLHIMDLLNRWPAVGTIINNFGIKRKTYYAISFTTLELVWLYDMQGDTWQRFTTGEMAQAGISWFPRTEAFENTHRSGGFFRPGANPNWCVFHSGVPVESQPFFTTRTFVLGDQTEDYRMLQAILEIHTSDACTIDIEVNCRFRDANDTVTQVLTVPNASTKKRPHRLYIRFDRGLVGNYFDFTVTLPADVDTITYSLLAQFELSGRLTDYAS